MGLLDGDGTPKFLESQILFFQNSMSLYLLTDVFGTVVQNIQMPRSTMPNFGNGKSKKIGKETFWSLALFARPDGGSSVFGNMT